jgi:hypothetical protein
MSLPQSYGVLQSAGSTTASEVAWLARMFANYNEAGRRVNIARRSANCFVAIGYGESAARFFIFSGGLVQPAFHL